MSSHSSTTPIESAWFSAVHALSVNDLQQLVCSHGNHLLGLQKRDPTDFEDVETSTEAQALLGADTTGMTAVHIALIIGEPQDSSVSSNSPHCVLAAKRLETLTYLIDASSTDQLRLRWGRGNTVLHLASFLGETEIIKALLAKGLPTHLKNELAFAPIDVAHDDATSDAFRSLAPSLRGEHRRIHSTSSSASSSFKRTGSNASVGSFNTEEPLSTVLQNRIAKQHKPISETMLPPSPSTSSPPLSQSPEESERPLTFTGKYIRLPPDEDIIGATTKPGSPLAMPPEQEPRTPLKGPKRRVVGVDLTLFDDVLGESGDGDSILPVPSADGPIKPASTPAMEQLSTKSLVSKNPFFQREKASASSTPPARSPIKPLSFRAASPASPVKAVSQESAPKKDLLLASWHNGGLSGNALAPGKKQPSLAHPTKPEQPHTFETQAPASVDVQEEVDRSAPDYSAIRATFAKMTVENPQVPKNPTERLANVFAMAAVNGDPARRKWKAGSAETPIIRDDEGSPAPVRDSFETPKLAEAPLLPKSSPELTDAKRPHQKSDSGVEREGLPSVWSQAQDQAVALPPMDSLHKVEKEPNSEQQDSSRDEIQAESKLVSVDSVLGVVKEGDRRETTDIVTIQEPASTFAPPPSLLLDLDLDLSFDDLESCLGFSEAIDSKPSVTATPSALAPEPRQAETVSPATQFEKHAAVLVAASKLAEANQPPRTFETTPTPRQPQSRSNDVSGLNQASAAPQFGGVPMPGSPRRAAVTTDHQDDFMLNHSKSRSASVTTNATIAPMTTARPASPRGRKQVTFTPGAEPNTSASQLLGLDPAVGTAAPASTRTSGIVTVKVSQIGGLEWVLAERQMCYVLVSVSKDPNAAPVFSSRPLLVLSDKVTLHEETSFDLSTSDSLFVEVKLRFERRQQAKSSIFSGFKLGKREDQVKDVKEEVLACQPLNPPQILSRTAGSVETEDFLVVSSKSTVTITVSTMVMPPAVVAG